MRISLRRLEIRDLKNFIRWYSDPEFLHWVVYSNSPEKKIPSKVPKEIVIKVFDEMRESKLVRAIILDGDTHIGTVGAKPGSENNPDGPELFIEIGDIGNRGKGYGTEASNQMLGLLFRKAKKIRLGVFEYNFNAISMYQNLGFVEFGRISKEIYHNGRYFDLIKMELKVDNYRRKTG